VDRNGALMHYARLHARNAHDAHARAPRLRCVVVSWGVLAQLLIVSPAS